MLAWMTQSLISKFTKTKEHSGNFVQTCSYIFMNIFRYKRLSICHHFIKISLFAIWVPRRMKSDETPAGDEIFFQEEANTFHLTVALSDNKLTVTLKDYVDWIIYSKEFTEEDIGQEIHRKMDLTDVYYSFSQT